MRQAEYTATRTDAADEELVEVLTAISVVSMRLARKLTVLAARSQSEEGGKQNEQNQVAFGCRRGCPCCSR